MIIKKQSLNTNEYVHNIEQTIQS